MKINKQRLAAICLTVILVTSLSACTNGNATVSSEKSVVTDRESSAEKTNDVTATTTQLTTSVSVTSTAEEDKIVVELEEYILKNQEIILDNIVANYPVISELICSDSENSAAVQDRFNGLLCDFALKYWTDIDSEKQYEVTYEIACAYSNGIDILYLINEEEGTAFQKHALSLNLNYGRYNHEQFLGNDEFILYNAWYVWEGDEQIEVLTEGVSNMVLSEYLHEKYGDNDTFEEHVRNAGNVDYETEFPLLWIYYSDKEEGWILLIPVSEEMGSYVEVKLLVGG